MAGGRERRRTARQKRKQRSAERRREVAQRRTEASARTEVRNRTARDALVPLREGERPRVITIGAVVSALVALSILAGYALGIEVRTFDAEGVAREEQRPPLLQVLAPSVLLAIMAWGMWRARYWAVLGFQVVLLIALIAASLGLVQATEWQRAIGNVVLIAGAGTMFFFMVKAMARIQMPERPTRAR